MKVYYPPVGIAHILYDISDLFKDRIKGARKLQVACISQPKSAPHFGTMIVIFSAFALAKKLARDFGIETEVLLDTLDNAPANEFTKDGITYSVCLTHYEENNVNVGLKNSALLLNILKRASSISGIPFRTRNYKDIQAQKAFREGLVKIIREADEFKPILSPSERTLRIRPICPNCGIVEKNAKGVIYDSISDPTTISFHCPEHGLINAFFDDPDCIIDANAPVRTVLRSVAFINERKENGVETIIINGNDWSGAWMQRVYFDGLSRFGFSGPTVPFNLFTPEITDWSGAKLSKTIYLENGAYDDLADAWLSVPSFEKKFNENGYIILWDEVTSWFESPKRFFRNYSIDYIKNLFEENELY